MENVNAIGLFYSDATYRLEPWPTAESLHGTESYVLVAVYHVQSPGLPNLFTVFSHDLVCGRLVRGGYVVREIDFPPNTSIRQHFFADNGSQRIGQILPGPEEVAIGGMHSVFQTKDYRDADYDAIVARAEAKAFELRSAVVPNSGTY